MYLILKCTANGNFKVVSYLFDSAEKVLCQRVAHVLVSPVLVWQAPDSNMYFKIIFFFKGNRMFLNCLSSKAAPPGPATVSTTSSPPTAGFSFLFFFLTFLFEVPE